MNQEKYIKFTMSKGRGFSLPEHKADIVINHENQLVQITDDDNNWTGETINKAHIVSTEVDKDRQQISRYPKLPESVKTDEDIKQNKKALSRMRKKLSKNINIKK